MRVVIHNHLRRRTHDLLQQVYKGYLVREDASGQFHVSKNGHHVYTTNDPGKAVEAIHVFIRMDEMASGEHLAHW